MRICCVFVSLRVEAGEFLAAMSPAGLREREEERIDSD